MQALYWNGRDLKLDSSYREPTADNQTAVVKVHLAGICSTDLQLFKGYMGFQGVPGHEFVGSRSPIVINEITVIGSRCGVFPDTLEALASHRVAVTSLIEKVYALEQGFEAVQHAARSGARKILLRP